MRLLPYGDRAVLAEVDGLDEAVALYSALDAGRRPGVLELVPAARTVLVRVDPRILPLQSARLWVEQTGARAGRARPPRGQEVVIPVRYDGEDLDETAALLGLTVGELVARHAATAWTSAFIGFAPGFAYLTGRRWRLDVPRLATARERVPAGAVGLAGGFSGVYPRASPGGWRLIGTTDAVLWDPDASHPALLAPGTAVRFEAVEIGPGRP